MSDKRTGAERISDERTRQVKKVGYSADHDKDHTLGELAMAACCYAAPARIYAKHEYANGTRYEDPWPWDQHFDARRYYGNVPTLEKNKAKRIRQLEKAGALIAAEIDRLLASKRKQPEYREPSE